VIFDNEVRSAATSWHSLVFPAAVAETDDDALPEADDVELPEADDDALPEVVPLDPHPVASNTPATRTTTTWHHANPRIADRLIATSSRSSRHGLSLPARPAPHIVRSG
jgi:hypothetical protein